MKAMVKQGYRDLDPRTQVLTDISTMIVTKRHEGCEVIIMIDANEFSTKTGSKWSEFVARHNMHDIHEVVCGEAPTTTRLGSQTWIDFIVATEGVLPYIRAGGYRSLHEAVVSDHILLWADIDTKAYFGGGGPSTSESVMNPIWILCTHVFDSLCPIWAQ